MPELTLIEYALSRHEKVIHLCNRKQVSQSMRPRDEKDLSNAATQNLELKAGLNRLDRIMDEPVVNERYSEMTMREMARKVVLRWVSQ